MKAMTRVLYLLLALASVTAAPAADPVPASEAREGVGAKAPAPKLDMRDGKTRNDRAPEPSEDLLADPGPPPGTCPVTEEIVTAYCAEHPDDAGCRAYGGD